MASANRSLDYTGLVKADINAIHVHFGTIMVNVLGVKVALL
jgi:hypothetical protein